MSHKKISPVRAVQALPLKAISLFSGAMGLDLGLERAGIQTAVCCEIDKWSCESIRLNRPEIPVLERSVVDLDPFEVAAAANVDPNDAILVGGPPCQSFSSAGNRAALNDSRGNLVFEYFRFVKTLRPLAFVFENVGNLLTAALLHRPIHLRPGKHWNLAKYSREALISDDADSLTEDEMSGSAFRYMLEEIHALGYSITFGILNAADFGAPQKRVRFCMLGFRECREMGIPKPTHGEPPLRPYVTLREAIADLKDLPGPHSVYTDRMADFFRLIPPGGNWRDLAEPHRADALGCGAAGYGAARCAEQALRWNCHRFET